MQFEQFVKKVEWYLDHTQGFEMRSGLAALVAQHHAEKGPVVVAHSLAYDMYTSYYAGDKEPTPHKNWTSLLSQFPAGVLKVAHNPNGT